MKKIGIFGLSANPFGNHHLELINAVLKLNLFDIIYVVLCGPRETDKPTVDDIAPFHRANMASMALRGFSRKVKLVFDDLENDVFTRTKELEEKYSKEGEVWHIIGYDLVKGKKTSKILTEWEFGEELWYNSRFIIVPRDGYKVKKADLPPNSKLITQRIVGSSTKIRNIVFNHYLPDEYVCVEVAQYIDAFGLYKGQRTSVSGDWVIPISQPLFYTDRENVKIQQFAEALKRNFEQTRNANIVFSLGGDGTIMDCVHKYLNRRLPIFGINLGSAGHLANQFESQELYREMKLRLFLLPVLSIEMVMENGRTVKKLAFNEIVLRNVKNKRGSVQGAILGASVEFNNQTWTNKGFGCDAVAVSTPQGSSAWTNSMGLPALNIKAERLNFACSNGYYNKWSGGPIPLNSRIRINNSFGEKRPVEAIVDSKSHGNVMSACVKVSRAIRAILAFNPCHDIERKNFEKNFEGFRLE